MSEFKVTRDLIQELAEIGSVQLPAQLTPPYDTFFRSCVNRAIMLRTATPFDRDVAACYPIWSTLCEVILNERGPFCFTGKTRVETAPCRNSIPNVGMHQDDFGQTLSCVWMADPEDDQLSTYGRNDHRTENPLATYRYSNGPILLAGEGFGGNLVASGVPTGPTWHIGQGASLNSPFFGLDLFTARTTRA